MTPTETKENIQRKYSQMWDRRFKKLKKRNINPRKIWQKT